MNTNKLDMNNLNITITSLNNDEVNIKGNAYVDNGSILEYYAANPPTYMFSYSGSALPYPNANVAYDNDYNSGKVIIKNNDFEFNIKYPNSFYSQLGNKYIEPHVIIQITDTSGFKYDPVFVKLDNGIPFRNLSHHPPLENWKRNNPFFYYNKDDLPLRSQEQILKDSSFPTNNKYPNNFWGLKPMQ